MSIYGAGNTWTALTGASGVPNRLSATTPAVPTALWHFDGALTPAVGGDTFGLTAGTTRYAQMAPDFTGLSIPLGTYYTLPSVAALQIIGDVTITMIVRVDSMADTTGGSVLLSMTASGETLATNICYHVALGRDGTVWLHEHGSGANDLVTLPCLPNIGDLCVVTARRASNVVTVWVDGKLSGTSSALTAAAGGSSTVLVLAAALGGSSSTAMEIGGLAIYNSALSDANIQSQHAAVYANMRFAS